MTQCPIAIVARASIARPKLDPTITTTAANGHILWLQRPRCDGLPLQLKVPRAVGPGVFAPARREHTLGQHQVSCKDSAQTRRVASHGRRGKLATSNKSTPNEPQLP